MESSTEHGATSVPYAVDQDWVKMLTNSPLFKAVNDIEEMIKDGVGPQSVLGTKGRPYIDIKVKKKFVYSLRL